MQTSNKISIEQYCIYAKIEMSFIRQLDEQGLINLNHCDDKVYIAFEQLPNLEKFARLYYELEINIAGIEAIYHLLNRLQFLQQKLKKLETFQ